MDLPEEKGSYILIAQVDLAPWITIAQASFRWFQKTVMEIFEWVKVEQHGNSTGI
jgi:hypothetical protein